MKKKNKDRESDALLVYHRYWDSYSNGDLEAFTSTLDEGFEMIGTSESEVCHSKDDGIAFFKSQMHEIVGRTEMRNRNIVAKEVNGMFLINEICDVYILGEPEWTFYSRLRLSTLLHLTDSGWKVIQQHGSLPDMRVQEGETIAFDKISKENLELRDAVRRRTAELENKNRELAIEAALEKVRAVAMGMKNPNAMLDVCRVIAEQLEEFGVTKIRNVQTAIIDENIGQYLCYQYFPAYGQTTIEDTEYHKSPVEHEMVRQMLASRDGHFTGSLSGKELEEFGLHRKEENHFPDPLLDAASEVSYCFLSIGEGGLGLSLYKEMEAGVLELFKRFHQVFSLAYQRFRDIQKAEAQTREAQIEAALERVRSRSMGMQKSIELGEVVNLLDIEIKGLSIKVSNTSIITEFSEKENGLNNWFSARGKNYLEKFHIPYSTNPGPVSKKILDAVSQGIDYYTDKYSKEEKDEYFKWLFKHSDFRKFPEDSKQFVFSASGWTRATVVSKNSLLLFQRFFLEEFSEQEVEIFKRFGKVFEQTYTRFLDLQKAEEQAREAEVELTLERVRARTMAMHHSSELADTAKILFQQIKELGYEMWSCGFGIWKLEVDLEEAWMSTGDLFPIILLPFKEDPSHLGIYEASQRGESVYEVEVKGEILTKHYDWLLSQPSFKIVFGQIENSGIVLPTVQYKYAAFFKQGYLHLITTKPQPDIHDISRRFAKVFEQTYTRFLDLQKAEAQAREAQIEAALERVRAKTMAMHNSEDVSSAIATLFSELDRQSIENVRCGIAIIDTNKTMEVWSVTNVEETHPDKSLGKMVKASGTLDMNAHKLWQLMYDAWRNKTGYLYYHLSGKDKQKYIDLINTSPGYLSQPLRELPDMHCQFYFFNEGAIWAYSLQPHTEPQQPVMKRFTSVFSQTYLRFRDLQKAEAQAREAQIEAALERVRSRSMAMHKSEELKEVIQLLFEQFRLLNFKIDSAQFDPNYKENDDLNLWTAAPGQPYSILLNIPYVDSPLFNSIKEAKKRGLSFITQQLSYEDKNQFFRHFFQHIKNIPAERQKLIFDSPGMYRAVVFMENVSLAIQNYSKTPYTEEENEVLKRFGKTFEQVYTRFLDLQKAEAQAREAQIEAALERVRSRSLAMHHSSELSAVVDTLLREFTSLEFTLTFCIINLIDEQDMSNTVWAANPETGKDPESYYMKFEDYPFHHAMWDAWKAQKKRFVYTIEGKEKKIYDEYLYSETEFRRFPKHVQEANKALDRYVAGFTFFKYSGLQTVSLNPISEDELEILERFGRVFEQAYTRFLDLQKAEAQGREAQIQLALERVRARTMSMQKSQELPEAANLLFQQIQSLGMPAWSAGYCTWKEDLPTEKEGKSAVTLWMSSEGVLQPPFTAPTTEDKLFIQMREGAEKGKDLHVVEMGGEELEQHYRYMRELPVVGEILDSIIEAGHPLPTFQIMHQAYFSKGFLLFITYEPVLESHDIFKRFAKVFDQTYTRFLDLQKAEAQAREAKIEAALERVRSRTMAMFKSEELSEVAEVLFTQVSQLGGMPDRISICVIDEPNQSYQVWATDQAGNQLTVKPVANLKEKTTIRHLYVDWKSGKKSSLIELQGLELKEWIAYLRQELGMPISTNHLQGRRFHNVAYFSHGWLNLSTSEPVADEVRDLLQRFASVFSLTYTRFLDLQKAEAQARESQIEAALERVRSRAMAMHNSQELKEVALELRKQMGLLGQKDLEVCAIHLYGYGEDSFESWNAMKAPGSEAKIVQSQAHFPKRGIRIIDEMMHHYTIGTKDYVLVNEGEKMAEWFKVLKKHAPELHASILDSLGKKPLKQLKGNWAVADFSGGALVMVTYGEPDELSRNLLRRSANVFEQAYVRFLDLQKAEAQAREAKIEAALEKVRSRTMAMQRSEELPEVAGLLFQQVKALGVPQFHCGFNIFEIDDKECTWYPGSADGDILPPCKIPLTEHPIFMNFIESRKRGDELCVYEKEGEYQAGHYRYMLSLPVLGEILQNMLDAGIPFPTFQIDHLANFSHGNLLFITSEHFPEMHDTFKRFAKVFEQTYTRFLDLQKAEAQAREAQIEAALERVRSRSMGMQRGADLKGVVKELYDQLRLLGFQFGVASIIIMDADTGDLDWWMEGIEDGYDLPEKYHVPYFDHKGHRQQIEQWKNGSNYAIVEISGIEKKAYDAYYFFQTDFAKAPENSKSLMMSLEEVSFSMAYMKYGSLSWSPSKLDENQAVVLQRMAKVFEQTYTRFLDLQKAEAQAREAQVEAALERLRSKTMAMHNSKDVGESVATLFDELTALGVLSSYDRCGIGIMQPLEMMEVWTAEKSTGKTELTIGYLDMRPHALLRNVYQSWLDRKETFHYTLEGEDKQLYAESIVNQPRYKIRKDYFSSLEVIEHTDFFFEEGCLYIFSVQPISNESAAVFSRFVKVFGQTYRRYLDLQKAEKQAREAQIEAALEKVRSRSLAMQSPDELIEVAQLLREEMGALGVEELETSSIYIQDESSGLTQCWFTIKNPDNPDKAITDQMVIDLQDTWVGQKMDEFYRSKAKQTSILMRGVERIEWIRYCEEKSDLFGTSNFYGETIPDRTYHLYKFSNGYIGAAAPGEISKESWDLLKRATTVFSFAYTRFRDIQMAQSSARAAMRQASLDRVRADISSMRNAEDLDRITPLIFKELTVLGVPFIRCGVFIIQEKQKIVEAYLSSPEGNSLGVLRLPYQASELTYQTVEAWRKGEVYRQHWNKEDFIRWINQLMELDQIQDSNTYQGSAVPPESLDLHFVPFTQGMIYVGAVYPLDDKDLELVQVLAKAFSIAYARFEDFVKLEQAKAEIESAMSELKATQSQLVQQEKLASLGQLTAGIAHEIKNPLNFVNNFSEVSIEMIEEALEEMEKREARDETLIRENLEDIKSNLKKVHEHGSRANGIVTSMLQHSRGGTGKKEATDLNALIQEYVNLSFHGMRAGKNPINVDIILDLDPEIKEVSLIKEDFSRVIINLCNNAFDAMKSVKTLHAASLRVSTKKQGDTITIEVSDNGPGIPDDIKDKILQPFFTTKKGTEGTGLGLSITHDIIKAHRGELEIETAINKGTKFTIKLSL